MKKTQIQSLGWQDLLEKEMATHYSILAWRTPWTEEPGGLQAMGSQRVRHYWATEHTRAHTHTHTHTHTQTNTDKEVWVRVARYRRWGQKYNRSQTELLQDLIGYGKFFNFYSGQVLICVPWKKKKKILWSENHGLSKVKSVSLL